MGLVGVLATVALISQGALSPPLDIQVLEATFVQQELVGGRLNEVPTTRIKYAPGKSCYSWILRVIPQDASVTLQENFRLPAPATQWNSDPATTIVSSRKSEATTIVPESLEDGILTHGWCVAEGDPTGKHEIEVFHNDRLLHRFKFEVSEELY